MMAWIVSRALVLSALGLSHLGGATGASLLDWDAAWYLDIAEHGYADARPGAIRFFPLWPLLVRSLAFATGLPAPVVLIVAANALALVYLVLARRVAQNSGLPPRATAYLPWVIALSPGAFVLVWGYSEALFGVLVCLVLLAIDRRRWWLCALAGLAAGADRPNGVLICLLVAVAAIHGLRGTPLTEGIARIAAMGAPAAGLASVLVWAGWTSGDPFAPFHAQLEPSLRGGVFVNPLATVLAGVDPNNQSALASFAIHLLWISVSIALLLATARRLPAAQTVYAAGSLELALTAARFGSFERYASGTLPLLLAASWRLSEVRRPGLVITILSVALATHTYLAFIGWYIP